MTKPMLWGGVALAVVVRVALASMGAQRYLNGRVEVVTPVTSLMRLAEGRWLKKLGLSPYAGSAYHGSPLLLVLLGPLTNKRMEGELTLEFMSSFLVFVAADLIGALLLYAIGELVQTAHEHYMAVLEVGRAPTVEAADKSHSGTTSSLETSHDSGTASSLEKETEQKNGPAKLGLSDVAALSYLLNPFTIAVCVGATTTPFENILVIMSLYGATAGNTPLAAFGWAMSTHLSMYPAILIIPITLLVTCGPDRPQQKVLDLYTSRISSTTEKKWNFSKTDSKQGDYQGSQSVPARACRPWLALADLVFWSVLWWLCIIGLNHLALGGRVYFLEMLSETYGFVLTVGDLSPNLGLFWYFFMEVFTYFRSFFIMVFHANILFVILPLTIRLHHRPLFLAFIMVAISTLLKSYPSVGDAALTLSLMSLFTAELSGFRFSFLILYGYLLVSALSPAMYNLWIWRGTGNANFYFAMSLVYAALQTILIVESVGTVIRWDRSLKIAMKEHINVVDSTSQQEVVG